MDKRKGVAGQERHTNASPVTPHLPEPTQRDREAGERARARHHARPKRVQINADQDGEKLSISPTHSDGALWLTQVRDAFGTTSDDFTNRMLIDLANAMPRASAGQAESVNTGLAVVAGLEPQNEIEAMLAVQMAATHTAALTMLQIARQNSTVPAIQAAGGLAVKLLRTFTAQTEALAKLRRGGNQTVRVEHVHVYEGGQAIVGNVNPPGGGGGHHGSGDQPHAPGGEIKPGAIALAGGVSLWGPDAVRGAVPVACGGGQGPVPDARRSEG